MSFKSKTILLLIVLGLTPYVITMVLLLNVFRSDLEQRLLQDMDAQLQGTLEQLDRQLLRLEKDLKFIASLDTMNDVLSGDLDGRINALLDLKKQDLNLIGEFLVTDTSGMVISSTDPARIQQRYSGQQFYEVPLYSGFIDGPIGQLIVEFSLENLQRNLVSSEYTHYQIITPETLAAESTNDQVLRVAGEIVRWPGQILQLVQSREAAFAALDRLTMFFYVALGVGTVVIAAIAYLVASYILRPILELSGTARAITDTQDYSQRVVVSSGDEIGELSRAFNHMLEGIQDMLRRLSEESENRIQLAQEKNRAEMLQSLSNKLSKYLSPQVYESIFAGETD
ncbi:MAG: HAMP domain-containing protein, partial [Pseudomonadales bacterium]|nr:HAMP domain-containing protein [Pseudomonadales bacterium]